VCGTAYAYEGAQLGADGALKSDEHDIGMLVLHRDDKVGEDVRVVLFWVCDDVRPVRGRFECCASELKDVIVVIYVSEECE